MKKIFKKIDILFLIISVVLFIVSFFTDRLVFEFNQLNVFNYICVKILYLLILVGIFQFLAAAKNGNEDYRKYIFYFVIYMIPAIVLLLLIWPGFWFGDVFNFVEYTTKAEIHYYLNYLSSVFYMIGYMLFPCINGATILMTCCFGMLFSFLMKNLKEMYNSKWIYLIIIPFAMFHTIIYSYYANRPIMYGVFYALLISFLLFEYLRKGELTNRKLIFLVFMTGLVGYWRSEAIYLIIVVPLFMFIIYKMKINLKNILKTFGLCMISFVIISLPQRIYLYLNPYDSPHFRNLTLFISPLSIMANSNLQGEDISKDWENINRVLDVNAMKVQASYVETYCTWIEPICFKTYTEDDYQKFFKSSIKLFKDNFNIFLKTKWYTFSVSTSINGDWFTNDYLITANGQLVNGIKGTNTIFDYKIRIYTFLLLEGYIGTDSLNNFLHFANSLYVPLLLIAFVFVYSICTKKILYFLMSGMLIGHTIILFFTSPAAYFMYYFNVYLTGFILFIILFIDYIVNVRNSEKHHLKK